MLGRTMLCDAGCRKSTGWEGKERESKRKKLPSVGAEREAAGTMRQQDVHWRE